MANYLYNGVELPDINTVWDKEAYPYAYITRGSFLIIPDNSMGLCFIQSTVPFAIRRRFLNTSDKKGGFALWNTESPYSVKAVTGNAVEWHNEEVSVFSGFGYYDQSREYSGRVCLNNLIWCSHDAERLPDYYAQGSTDDEVYMKPVLTGNIFLTGSEPILSDFVSFRYNVVTLRDVYTSWNRREYPFTVLVQSCPHIGYDDSGKAIYDETIYDTPETKYILCFKKKPVYRKVTLNYGGFYTCLQSEKAGWCGFRGYAPGEVSIYPEYEDDDSFTLRPTNNSPLKAVVWSDFDILNEDGTLYHAASDPIPVNPVPTYDPEALLQGYLVGCRLRAMRGKKPTEPDAPVEPEYDVVFENGVLYIKKAPAVMVGTTLSLAALDIKGGD